MCRSGYRVPCPNKGCDGEITCVYEFECQDCSALTYAYLMLNDEDEAAIVNSARTRDVPTTGPVRRVRKPAPNKG